MADNKNMFKSFGTSAEERAEEQKKAEAKAKGTTLRKRGENATTMLISMSMEDKMKAKEYAARHATTVADMFHAYISSLED